GLKFDEGSPLQREAFSQWGLKAKRMGRRAPQRDHFTWRGRFLAVGSAEHLDLLRRALWAKFTQSDKAKRALLATRGLTLTHNVAQSSKTVLPGAAFAQMLMDLRDALLAVAASAQR